MSCTQTLSGLASDCNGSIGGVSEVLIANFADVSSVTVSDDKISAITMASSAKFKKYTVRPEACSLTKTLNVTPAQNTKYVSSELAVVFNRMETTKRKEVSVLALGELAIIVKDANGAYWYLGKENAVYATAGTGETGTARGDKNAYSITFTDNASDFPYEVDSSIISGLLS